MKAIKEAFHRVSIYEKGECPHCKRKYWWSVYYGEQNVGTENSPYMKGTVPTREEAIRRWEEYAELNGITNYEIVEEK